MPGARRTTPKPTQIGPNTSFACCFHLHESAVYRRAPSFRSLVWRQDGDYLSCVSSGKSELKLTARERRLSPEMKTFVQCVVFAAGGLLTCQLFSVASAQEIAPPSAVSPRPPHPSADHSAGA